MSTNPCDRTCQNATINLPIKGIGLTVDASALPGGGQTTLPGGGLISYSLEEQWTGAYWIDGRKIYQKTFEYGDLPKSAPVVAPIPHHIKNFGRLIDAEGTTRPSEGYPDTVFPSPQLGIGCTEDTVYVHATSVFVGTYNSTCITIRYTCTDR